VLSKVRFWIQISIHYKCYDSTSVFISYCIIMCSWHGVSSENLVVMQGHRRIIFHFHYNMPKVVKYGNFAPENVAVYLDALTKSRVGFVQHHVTIIFDKIRIGSLSLKIYAVFCLASVRNKPSIFYISCNPQCFPNSLQFAVLSEPLRDLRPTSAGKVSVKQCVMLRVQRMF